MKLDLPHFGCYQSAADGVRKDWDRYIDEHYNRSALAFIGTSWTEMNEALVKVVEHHFGYRMARAKHIDQLYASSNWATSVGGPRVFIVSDLLERSIKPAIRVNFRGAENSWYWIREVMRAIDGFPRCHLCGKKVRESNWINDREDGYVRFKNNPVFVCGARCREKTERLYQEHLSWLVKEESRRQKEQRRLRQMGKHLRQFRSALKRGDREALKSLQEELRPLVSSHRSCRRLSETLSRERSPQASATLPSTLAASY